MSPDVISLLILGITILLFLTNWIPSTATAVLGCALMVLTGVSKFSTAFSGFSNSIVVLVFALQTVGMAMHNSGLAYKTGKLILRFAYNERLFVVIAILISGCLSMFLANTAVIAMFIAIMNSVVNSSDTIKLKHICLPVTMGAMFGGVCTLVGSTPQMMVQSIMEENAGITYKMFDYMPVGLILMAVLILYYLFIGYPLGHRMWKDDEDDSDQEKLSSVTKKANLTVGTVRDQIIVGVVMVIMFMLFITEIVSNTMAAVIAMFLLIVTRQISETDVIQNMDWRVLIRLAGCLGLASCLADSKGGELIASSFIGVFGQSISPTMLLILTVILTMVISNFITNSTAIFIVLPPMVAIASSLGYSCLPLGIACCYAGNLCFATPLANAQTGLTMVAGYKFSDYVKYNGLLEIIVAAVIIFFVPIFF